MICDLKECLEGVDLEHVMIGCRRKTLVGAAVSTARKVAKEDVRVSEKPNYNTMLNL